jgi:hypothetical protein
MEAKSPQKKEKKFYNSYLVTTTLKKEYYIYPGIILQ